MILRCGSRTQRVLPSRPRPQNGTRHTLYMQQGYLRHIGFWPADASCLVLCSALRCAALPSRSALLGLDFPTRPSSAPVLNHLTFQICLSLLVLLLCPALPAVDALGSSLQSSPSHGRLLARAANLLRSVLASLELISTPLPPTTKLDFTLPPLSTRQLPSSSPFLPSSRTVTPLPRLSIPGSPATHGCQSFIGEARSSFLRVAPFPSRFPPPASLPHSPRGKQWQGTLHRDGVHVQEQYSHNRSRSRNHSTRLHPRVSRVDLSETPDPSIRPAPLRSPPPASLTSRPTSL